MMTMRICVLFVICRLSNVTLLLHALRSATILSIWTVSLSGLNMKSKRMALSNVHFVVMKKHLILFRKCVTKSVSILNFLTVKRSERSLITTVMAVSLAKLNKIKLSISVLSVRM